MRISGFLLAAGHSRRFGSDKRLHQLPDGRTLMQASLDSISAVCDEVLIAVRHEDIGGDSDAQNCNSTEPELQSVSEAHPRLLNKLTLQSKHSLHRMSHNNAGMGDSLATLAKALLERNSLRQDATHAVLVALADMPFIEASTLQTLTREAQRVLSASEDHASHATASEESTYTQDDSSTPPATGQAVEHLKAPTLIVAPRHAGARGHPVLFSATLLNELTRCSGDTGARDVLESFKNQVFMLDVDDAGVVRDIDTL